MFRHAKSDWSDENLRDFDRGLNSRGRKGAALMGRHIRDYGLRWQRTIASPAARVRQTIEAAAQAAGECPPIAWEERAYLASSTVLFDILHGLDDRLENVMLCGHSPGLEMLLLQLAGGETGNPLLEIVRDKYPTAAFAVLELAIDHWADLGPGCGRLVHLVRPRDLDSELGPEFA
jgi:phosphohistidine phosphatase